MDQGPSLRNISSFLIQNREEKVKMVIPEHVPAFAKKKFIQKAKIDPRTFLILGDTEAALSAVDALRTHFTGRIVLVPTSSFGSFQNTDIFTRKFGEVSKNEAYYVEPDYLDRANVDIIQGDVK